MTVCTRTAHANEDAARRAMRRVGDSTGEPYRCRKCLRWHVRPQARQTAPSGPLTASEGAPRVVGRSDEGEGL